MADWSNLPHQPYDALKYVTRIFRGAEIDGAGVEARWLFEHVTGLTYNEIIAAGAPLTTDHLATLREKTERRLGGEPLAYITGRQGFWKQDLYTGPDALIPRGDTETLVETVLKHGPRNPARILDMGTGSGAIFIALMCEYPKARGIATDISAGALDIARKNLEAYDLESRARIVQSDWYENIKRRFDIVVSNPPYIPDTVIEGLHRDVKDYEPYVALSGGADGLTAYRIILSGIHDVLAPDAIFAVEIGYNQAEAVSSLFKSAGFPAPQVVKDSAGMDRVVWTKNH